MTEVRERLTYLDGLRGIAAFAVVVCHINILITISMPDGQISGIPRLIFGRLTNGDFAVCIFFVLSGYVLVTPFAAKRDTSGLGEAALRRYFRLTPVAFVSVLLSFFIWKIVGYKNVEMLAWGPGFDWMATVYNFEPSFFGALRSGLFGIYAGDNSYNQPLWTIQIELWGSLFLFAFVALTIKSRNVVIISAITSIVLISYFNYSIGIYISLFLAGAMINFEPRLIGRWYLVIPALYLGSLDEWSPDALFIMSSLHLPWSSFENTVPPHAIGAILLLSGTLGSERIQSFLTRRCFTWLGQISFSLYVVHWPIIFSIGNGAFLALARTGNYWLGALCATVSVLIVSCVAAMLVHRYVDIPSQRMARYIGRKIYSSRPTLEIQAQNS